MGLKQNGIAPVPFFEFFVPNFNRDKICLYHVLHEILNVQLTKSNQSKILNKN